MVPGEICMERSGRSNRGHIRKAALNMQKSAEAIVPGDREGWNQCSRSNRRKEGDMEKVENVGNGGCPQRDSTECEGYAGARSVDRPENGERALRTPNLLERILDRDNLNKAYKRVKANKGAPGVDGMTVEEALSWLKEHGKELTDRIRQGKYKPDPVRRKEIPKPDGGVRNLGIPSVKDRIVQQAVGECEYDLRRRSKNHSTWPLVVSGWTFRGILSFGILEYETICWQNRTPGAVESFGIFCVREKDV